MVYLLLLMERQHTELAVVAAPVRMGLMMEDLVVEVVGILTKLLVLQILGAEEA
jgi:hypothetical protein